MIPAQKTTNESERLRKLDEYAILDSMPEDTFDDLTRIAAELCGTPVALISLIDEDRQWFKSKQGFAEDETSRDVSFCGHAIQTPSQLMEVSDTRTDKRFLDNPLVDGRSASFRFYAGAPLVSPDGYPMGTICVLDNHTRKLSKPQKEALMALSRQVMNQMELRVKIKELDEARKQADETTRIQQQFLSSMSHEIRTPLNAVLGSVYLLMGEQSRNEQLEYLKILKFSSENLMSLINDVLDVNKIESDKIVLEQLPILIKELIFSIQGAHSIRAESKGIKVFSKVDENIPPVLLGDSVRLSQVLNNLIGNAVKFTTKGTVQVELSLLEKQNGQVTIQFQVKDTGIGIPHESLAVIFEQFTQADHSITRRFGGSGLGLFITKKLLNLMQSEIRVQSEEGKGSTFSFNLTLPYEEGELSTEGSGVFESENVMNSRLKKKDAKVLVVDDNLTNQMIVSKYLQKWQIESAFAGNGKEAIAMLQDKTFDLVLMDIQMPVMDGYSAVKVIRQEADAYFQHLPIVALTASTLMEVREKIFETGMNDFISKPFTPNQLWRTLVNYLDEYPGSAGENQAHPSESLDRILEEITDGDEAFKKELVQAYLQNFREFISEAVVSVSKGDTEQLNSHLHKIKPSMLALGYEEAYDKMRGISEKFEVEETQTYTDYLQKEVDQIIKSLEKVA